MKRMMKAMIIPIGKMRKATTMFSYETALNIISFSQGN
jgi:hypothetical protein